MKAFLCILLALSMALSVSAESTWQFEDGVLTVGQMEDYPVSGAPWESCNGEDTQGVKKVVLSPGITAVGSYAFRFFQGLEQVVLPEGITAIGTGAFSQCTGLKAITLPRSLVTVGDFAFQACRSLTEVTLPEGVQTVGISSFNVCENLSKVTLPQSLRTIDDSAFSQCEGLKELVIPAGVEYLGDFAFGSNGTMDRIVFEGHAPRLGGMPFGYEVNEYVDGTTTLTAFYPRSGKGWTEEHRAAFGGNTTWVCYGFADVLPGSYCFRAAVWAEAAGITTGVSEGLFDPDGGCTRAQAVTFLWRAAGCPKPEGACGFADVAGGSYYYDAVCWAVEQGITTGVTPERFAPEERCTRGQIVTFLHRAAGCPEGTGSGFADVAKGSYCHAAVLWAAEKGITTGVAAGRFAPDEGCSRGQIVTFLMRRGL